MSNLCLALIAYCYYLFGGKEKKNKMPEDNTEMKANNKTSMDKHFAMSIRPFRVSRNDGRRRNDRVIDIEQH
jgi:hypothetical protein